MSVSLITTICWAVYRRARAVVRGAFARFGLQIRRVPPSLLRAPDETLCPALEHLVAMRQLQLGAEPFTFLQIGAFDGKTGDPIFDFVKRFGWRGLLVEPQPAYFRALKENYRALNTLIYKNVAVSDRRETRPLYTIREDSPRQSQWAPQMASFDREYLLGEGFADDDLATITVECVTTDDLLDELGTDLLDLLQIDVEGHDYEVLQSFNFSRCKPAIVRFEHKHLSRADHDASVRLLLREGYQVAPERAGDTLAWRRS
jgi:FkbM family methyltransferase